MGTVLDKYIEEINLYRNDLHVKIKDCYFQNTYFLGKKKSIDYLKKNQDIIHQIKEKKDTYLDNEIESLEVDLFTLERLNKQLKDPHQNLFVNNFQLDKLTKEFKKILNRTCDYD